VLRIMRAAPDRRSADGDGRPQLLDADRRGLELRLAALASRGLGIAILPESVARVHPELHAIEVTRPAMRGRLALAWRTGGTDQSGSPGADRACAVRRDEFGC